MTPFDYQALTTLPTVRDIMHVLLSAERDGNGAMPTPQALYAQILLIVARSREPLTEADVWKWPYEYLHLAMERVIEGMNYALSAAPLIKKHGVQ